MLISLIGLCLKKSRILSRNSFKPFEKSLMSILKDLVKHEIESMPVVTQIHKGCCKHCPSKRIKEAGMTDPETEDFKAFFTKEEQAQKAIFPCAWRPDKFCKGICDEFDINQKYLDNIIS